MGSQSHLVVALHIFCSGSVTISCELVLSTLFAACHSLMAHCLQAACVALKTRTLLASHAVQVCTLL